MKSDCTPRRSSPRTSSSSARRISREARPRARRNQKGYVRGFDAKTGKRLWIFHTIPRPGEFGNDTWEKDSWAYTGNTGVWAQMSDRRRARPRVSARGVADGRLLRRQPSRQRALRREPRRAGYQDGKRKWHYQLVHHGIWDMDIPCAPILADITVDGQDDQGDRAADEAGVGLRVRSHDRQAGVADRRAARGKSTVPGEKTSPTQPFVTKPPAFDRQGVSVDDLIDFTPELHAKALEADQELQASDRSSRRRS